MNFQVVWGKVKGYPWWPAVVSSNQIDLNDIKTQFDEDKTLTCLQFLGENKQ